VNLEPKYAASQRDEDVVATRLADAYMNRQYLDAACLGGYPDEMREIFGDAWPEWPAADMAVIKQPLDFIGVNYYTRNVTEHWPPSLPLRWRGARQPHAIYTETGWEVHAPSLTRILVWVKERYGNPPLYITENGAAFYDPPKSIDGRIDDPLRVHYYREHLKATAEAMRQGVDVRGYYAWSLLDNFEWSLGFSKRFGIVHVDYKTQQRTVKASGRFYSDVIGSNGGALD